MRKELLNETFVSCGSQSDSGEMDFSFNFLIKIVFFFFKIPFKVTDGKVINLY